MKQLKLFSELQPNCSKRFPQLEMSVGTLHQWKQRIFDYQQSASTSQPQQQTLFELAPNPCNVDTLDPFSLQIHNLSFCDQPDAGDRTCLYFAMAVAPAIAYDTAKPTPLLLYVGETERSPKQRWMNHYCYNYVRESMVGCPLPPLLQNRACDFHRTRLLSNIILVMDTVF